MIKAALIDLDGFLINSEQLYSQANKIYFKDYNLEFTDKLHREGTGRKFEQWIKTVVKTDKTGEQILKERNIIFFKIAKKKLQLLPGAKEFLKMAHDNFKTALVTSSNKDYVELVFKLLPLSAFFDLVITGEQITKGKPSPQPYLKAANKLGVKPQECVVFEDAPNGVVSGKNAGMKVVAIPSKFVTGDKTFAQADLILDSLEGLKLQQITNV